MAVSREKKETIIREFKEKLNQAKILLFTDFRGLTVKDTNAFRKELRKNGIDFQVIKKTLLKRAFDERDVPFDPKRFEGQIAVVAGYGDEIEAPKLTYGFSRQNANLKIVGGMMGLKEISVEEIFSLAKLLSREVLLGKLVFLVASPMTQFVKVLGGNTRNLVSVLRALFEKPSPKGEG